MRLELSCDCGLVSGASVCASPCERRCLCEDDEEEKDAEEEEEKDASPTPSG